MMGEVFGKDPDGVSGEKPITFFEAGKRTGLDVHSIGGVPTSLKSDVLEIDDSPSPQALSAVSVPCTYVLLQAATANTGSVYVGTLKLAASPPLRLDISNVQTIQISGSTAGDKVEWLAVSE